MLGRAATVTRMGEVAATAGRAGWCAHRLVTRALAGLWLSLTCAPALSAQSDSLTHATLQHWAEQSWLLLLDRHGSVGGRLSEDGVLQRFQDSQDDKYFLDRFSATFLPRENYDWYARDNGVRWFGGSINRRNLVTEGEFKTSVPLSQAWAIGVRFNKEDNPSAQRNAMRIGLKAQFPKLIGGFANLHLDPNKPGTDIEIGGTLGERTGANAVFSVSVLDAVNNVVYVTLDAASQAQIESTLVYDEQPIAFRTQVMVPFGRSLRVEAYGLYVTPSALRTFAETSETDGFIRRERIAYAGGLVEWKPFPTLFAGFYANTIWAESEQEKLAPTVPVDEYVLTEQTTQVGAFATWRITRRWLLDTYGVRTWRPERRQWGDPGLQPVDYLLRSWHVAGIVTYRSLSGFVTDAGLAWNDAEEPYGGDQVPATGSLTTRDWRVRYDIGWKFGDTFSFLIGGSIDYDGETDDGWSFGGGRGKFSLYW
ncbi:MAG: hypothetical protein JSW71_07240 [Gemmatimonadota bacterium]|nr:MAG: hypothetical protein JSW71_07240 [Gemmatimonadota bacterium]